MSQIQSEEQVMMNEGEAEMSDEQLAAYLQQVEADVDAKLVEDASNIQAIDEAIAAAKASIEN